MRSLISLKSGCLFLCMCGLHFSLHPSTERAYCCGMSCEQRPLPVVYSGIGSIEFVSAIFWVPSGRRWSSLSNLRAKQSECSNVSLGVTVLDQLLVMVLSERILSSAKRSWWGHPGASWWDNFHFTLLLCFCCQEMLCPHFADRWVMAAPILARQIALQLIDKGQCSSHLQLQVTVPASLVRSRRHCLIWCWVLWLLQFLPLICGRMA